MPTGKQNTFANRTLPDGVLVTLRKDQPINFAGAFERPVQSGRNNDQGFVQGSATALAAQAKNIYGNWLAEPVRSFVVGDILNELGDPIPMKEMISALRENISEMLGLVGDHR